MRSILEAKQEVRYPEGIALFLLEKRAETGQ